ncbi:UNVERIFIED_ORG: hypothetical protein ABIB19_002461 [Arthrobacter sp. UYEF10]
MVPPLGVAGGFETEALVDEADVGPAVDAASVMVTLEAAAAGAVDPSQSQVKTTRLPGSISVNVPAADCPGVMVQRYSPPTRRSTRAATACHRRNRSGRVIRAKAVSGSTGMKTDLSVVIRVRLEVWMLQGGGLGHQ